MNLRWIEKGAKLLTKVLIARLALQRWLFKQEPSTYSYSQLEKDGRTVWDGVSNNLALKHLRLVSEGDTILFYHSGDERQIVGIMKAISSAYARSIDGAEKSSPVVDVKPVMSFPKPVSLTSIKNDSVFSDWELVRISRLSVMPVPQHLWTRILSLGGLNPSGKAIQIL